LPDIGFVLVFPGLDGTFQCFGFLINDCKHQPTSGTKIRAVHCPARAVVLNYALTVFTVRIVFKAQIRM